MHAHAAGGRAATEDGVVLTSAIDLSGYEVTDAFFGRPFIDVDEDRDRPSPHRFVQGGFAGTDTEFAFYFPPGKQYTGRMFQPLEGGNGGHAVTFGGGILGEMFQRIAMSARLGGYMVESNQGHKGDDFDPKAGEDPTLYGHRASAESARLSKYVAAQVYGSAPHHSYVWGGSAAGGGGRGCAWRPPRGCGTAACRRPAAARSPRRGTPSGSRPGPSCRSARCSTSSGSWAGTRSSRWRTGWRPAAAATRSTGWAPPSARSSPRCPGRGSPAATSS